MINPAETTKLESAKLAALRTSTKCTGIAKARQSRQSYRHRHNNCAQMPRALAPDAAPPQSHRSSCSSFNPQNAKTHRFSMNRRLVGHTPTRMPRWHHRRAPKINGNHPRGTRDRHRGALGIARFCAPARAQAIQAPLTPPP